MSKNTNASFRNVSYHGGFDGLKANRTRGKLVFSPETIGVGKKVISTTSVVRVDFGVEREGIKSVPFIPGTTSGGKERTPLAVHLSDGQVGYYTVNQSPAKVKGSLSPWLRSNGIEVGGV